MRENKCERRMQDSGDFFELRSRLGTSEWLLLI